MPCLFPCDGPVRGPAERPGKGWVRLGSPRRRAWAGRRVGPATEGLGKKRVKIPRYKYCHILTQKCQKNNKTFIFLFLKKACQNKNELPCRALLNTVLMSIFKKSRNLKESIKITIRTCVQERRIDPNPTHYNNFDKYTENRKNNTDWCELGNYIALPIPL